MDFLDMMPEYGPDGEPLKKEHWISLGRIPTKEEIDYSRTTFEMIAEYKAILNNGSGVTWLSSV